MDFSALDELSERVAQLGGLARSRHEQYLSSRREHDEIGRFLELAPKASQTLDQLSSTLFGELLDEIETNLTHAVREVLGQDRTVISERSTKSNKLQVHFSIHSGSDPEQREDILSGQGGSVANILSVGLRLIALSQLDPFRHRPFLVLDEQDCWLKPELVPRFMKLIAQIAERLGLQLLVISHHPVDKFSTAADRILELIPDDEHGPRVRALRTEEDR
ncbi:MAG: hypothetical protein AB7D47_07735 [Desulfovibrio sp.]|jgi:hypothetical protein